jgi:hypothetical protein
MHLILSCSLIQMNDCLIYQSGFSVYTALVQCLCHVQLELLIVWLQSRSVIFHRWKEHVWCICFHIYRSTSITSRPLSLHWDAKSFGLLMGYHIVSIIRSNLTCTLLGDCLLVLPPFFMWILNIQLHLACKGYADALLCGIKHIWLNW